MATTIQKRISGVYRGSKMRNKRELITDKYNKTIYCINLIDEGRNIISTNKLVLVNLINPLQVIHPPINNNVIKLAMEWAELHNNFDDVFWGNLELDKDSQVIFHILRNSYNIKAIASHVHGTLVNKYRIFGGYDSVNNFKNAYLYSLFCNNKSYAFKSCVELWNLGFIPSFDGTIWRIHCGAKADVLYDFSHNAQQPEK